MSKQLTYKNEDNQIERYDITDQDAGDILDFLSDPNKTVMYVYKNQSMISNRMRVKDTKERNQPAFMEFHWTDDELEKFETEIFERFTTLNEYLIAEGVIGTDDRIKNPHTYRMLTAKWSKLNELRYTKEKQSGFKGREEQLKKMKESLKQVIKPIQKPDEPIQNEPMPEYKIDEIVDRDKIDVNLIPF